MDFLQLTQLRHSVRHYATRPVEPEKIYYILECARLAPSAVNKQPWRFILVRSEEARAKVQRCYPREWFAEAPLYIIICAVETEAWVRPCDSKNHADIDAAIATEHICLAAADRGLGSCWVCNFDKSMLQELFQVPSGAHPVAIVPIGYPAETERPELRRKPMEQLCCEDRFPVNTDETK